VLNAAFVLIEPLLERVEPARLAGPEQRSERSVSTAASKSFIGLRLFPLPDLPTEYVAITVTKER
jgi:hypothetical protein